VVGNLDDFGLPNLASVGTRGNSSNVWLLGDGTLDSLSEDYAAIKCNAQDTLTCQGGNGTLMNRWQACGLMLDLAGNEAVGNCAFVTLVVLRS
jgi:hypothetical protein